MSYDPTTYDDTPAARYAAYIRGSQPDAAPMWDATDVGSWADAAERYASTLSGRGVNDAGYRDLVAKVRQNPNGYYLVNGTAVRKPMSSAKAIGLGAAYLGGLSAVGALGGGAASGTLGGISTGAVAPPMTPIAGALAGGAVPGATGAVVGAGTGAGMGAASWIGRGIDAGANIYGANRANAASNRAAEASERGAAAELAFLREQEAERRRQWEADQAFQAQKWAAEEEERAFNRTEAQRRAALEQQTFASNEDERLYRRRMEDERDRRRAPYRAASEAALGRLGTLLTSGQSTWRSPSNAGRGTLGAMVGR